MKLSAMKISVVTATYNCAATLPQTLASVASQDYAEAEHIVVDGASRDDTLSILRAHQPRLAALVSEPDRGIYDALNKGIALARGDVIGFMHADDMFAHHRVLSRVSDLMADPRVDAVYGDLVYVRRERPDKVVRYWRAGAFSRAKLAWGWMPPHPTVYMRRSVFERVGAFDIGYRISADYDHLMRMLWRERLNVAYIPEVMVKMRLGGISNRSLASVLRKSREDLAVLRSHGVGGLGSLAAKNLSKLGQFFPSLSRHDRAVY